MRKQLIFPILLGLSGAAILICLGFWQVARLDWKQAVLAEIETKIAAAPVALPVQPDALVDNRRSVRVRAKLDVAQAHVISSHPNWGPGYRIITPALSIPDNRQILIDMGYVPEQAKDKLRGPATVEVVGNLLWPDEIDSFTPDPNLERNIWFGRDVEKLAQHFQTEPVLIVARDVSGDSFDSLPVAIGHNIPNNHLQYAVTWFGLAAVWLWMTGLWIWRIRHKTD